ncbi:arylsulfatase [Novosphingobium sp. PhB165]|uniref:arylsulfatase n=1 Tax=Novosphingobium sp. PhB165 TaxID=2485105 RepID=UPI001043FFA8|nr:arylsulfatase [Novosphingobium sp. PhB165]TCM20370.1 arylsulfatase [Novosphingobium sp. PhB165]
MILRRRLLLTASLTVAGLTPVTGAWAQSAPSPIPGTPVPASSVPVTASTLVQKPAPKGAPNILIVLLDDVGFGAASTFGGPAQTTALDALAHDGLRFNRFHTAGICSPSRAALLTGRNPHATGIGAVMNTADGRPGYTGYHGKDTATIAEILRENGYSTAAFGKWHQTPDWEMSPSGPFDRWPTGEGFESFYGFIGGETNEFEPTLFNGTTPTMRPAGTGYHLSEDLAAHSIDWLRRQHSVTPDKPFFLYLATGGIHAPIQVPKPWIDRYRGQFDQGWDKLREEIFAREKRLGVIPKDARLTPRPAELPAWDSLSAEEKAFSSRLMEAYAAYLAHTDAQVGKVVQALKDSGQYDNTVIVYLVGDNGASMEGGTAGSLSYLRGLIGFPAPPVTDARLDDIGTRNAYAHVNAAWAWATDTPFPWGKSMAGHLGAIRNPMVITWPNGIKDKGGLRSQFGHINDVVPTLLDIVGIEAPKSVDGIAQKPMNGVSLRYTFDAPKAAERHNTQYFEVFGRRSIYHDGWFAMANHGPVPWKVALQDTDPAKDVWQLYDLRSDFSESTDLAAKEPARLEDMKRLFEQEAAANQVLPISGPKLFGRGLPDLAAGVKQATFHAGAVGIPETALPKVQNRSWGISATLRTDPAAQGVVAAVGGESAGWTIFVDAGHHAVFRYRAYDLQTLDLRSAAPLSAGQHRIDVDIAYQGQGFANGADVTLNIDGHREDAGKLRMTLPTYFTIDETFDVGIDRGSPVGDYPADAAPGYAFAGGAIGEVTISQK